MGSILKIITSTSTSQAVTKATLLGARDSMEIASTTKLRKGNKPSDAGKVVIKIGSKKSLHIDEEDADNEDSESYSKNNKSKIKAKTIPEKESKVEDEDDVDDSLSALGSLHNDSMQIIQSHVPDPDHKINYEKVCPMEKCQRLQVDSFVLSLPPYMRASPFTHFEQTFEEYEPCSPEQLEILKHRIQLKLNKEKTEHELVEENPLSEWNPSVEGIAVQTSDISMTPPCTCRVPSPTPVSSTGKMYNLADLIPVKEALDRINKECFYDSRIQFDRFKVIGEASCDDIKPDKEDFKTSRLQEIQKILKKHPSLLDIFQANTQC